MFNQMVIISKTVYAFCIVSLVYVETVFLGLNFEQVLAAIAGALVGACVLTYYRPETTAWQALLKIIMSIGSSVILGTGINKYFGLVDVEYTTIVYFIVSIVALILIRAGLSATDTNANAIVTTIFQKILRITPNQVETETKITTAPATKAEVKAVHKDLAETLPSVQEK